MRLKYGGVKLNGSRGQYCITGNFRGRKLLRILKSCSYSQKFSSWNWGRGIFLRWHKWVVRKSFLRKNLISAKMWKFFPPRKFAAIRYLTSLTSLNWHWPDHLKNLHYSNVWLWFQSGWPSSGACTWSVPVKSVVGNPWKQSSVWYCLQSLAVWNLNWCKFSSYRLFEFDRSQYSHL